MSFISRILKPGRAGEPEDSAESPPKPAQQKPQRQAATKQQQQRQPLPSSQRRPPGGCSGAAEPSDALKIVIRGDSSVGKSSLLVRLQGGAFVEEYAPTERPHSAIVRWNCGARAATLQVWDAVDAGRPRRARSGLKLANDCDNRSPGGAASAGSSGGTDDASAAAAAYAGCHGAVLMLDMTKAWTLTYVERELARAPPDLPLLVLANHRDMGHHRCVTADQARMAIRDSGRPLEITRYAESSMRNGYGLKYVHRFLCLPYLCAQRQRLLRRLSANADDTATAVLELQLEEEESRQAIEGTDARSRKREYASKNSSSSHQPPPQQQPPQSPPPPQQVAPPTVGRISAPPARLIPGAEQYLLELRRAQLSQHPPLPQPESSSPPSPPRSRPEPAGADDDNNVSNGDVDLAVDEAAVDVADAAIEATDVAADAGSDSAADNADDEVATAVVSTFLDDIDSDGSTAKVATSAAAGNVVEAPDEAPVQAPDEAEPEEPVETAAVTPAPIVDWGPLLARYEDEPPRPPAPPPPLAEAPASDHRQQRVTKKKRKKTKPQQPEAEPQEPVRSKPKAKSKEKVEKSSKAKSGKRSTAEPQLQPKVAMTKEEEELERFLNE